MAYTTVDNGEEYFNTVLWTGDASSDKSISGVGFQPDWVWAKNRSDSNDNQVIDSTRGAGKILRTNSTGTELTRSSDVGAGGLQNFESDGFDVHSTSTNTNLNDSGELNVGWCWKVNGGTTSTNNDGSITSTVQVNTTAGISILTYSANATAGATVGHGLGTTPAVVILKQRSGTGDANWMFGHKAYVGNAAENIALDGNSYVVSADDQAGSTFYRTAFTSTVFTLGDGQAGDWTGRTNRSGYTMVAYCFAEIEGYSKMGSYTGNGNADGTFVYTGFKPAWLLFKQTNASGENWRIFDNKRSPFNQVDDHLFASSSSAENDETGCDFLSNGFKWRNSDTHQNGNDATYIYMAFAEHPFVSSKGVPVTAR